jgi:carbohydrate-selective porin OprB
MAGFAFPDLFKEGAMAGIAVGQPFIESQIGNATQTNLELFYNFPVTNNIRITPDVQFIFNPNNNSTNSTIFVGTLRTVFSF